MMITVFLLERREKNTKKKTCRKKVSLPHAIAARTCSNMRNIAQFHEPRRAKLEVKPL